MAACTLPCNSNLPQTLKRQNISKQRNYYQDKVFQQLSTAVCFQNYLHKLGNKAKISLYIPLKRLFPSAKITLLISHSDWSNLVAHQVINKSNPHIQLTLVHTNTLHHNFLKRKYTRFQEIFPTVKARL